MTDVQILTARDVPLGGVRAIDVRRTLPHKSRSLVGAWCFADHYGPQPVGAGNDGGMDVPPHPHTGLATVSWLFEGTIEHRDSDGVVAPVLPGEVNLMNAGRGIAHSEVSIAPTTVLHGVQLWVALPREHRDGPRDFQHHTPAAAPLPGEAGTARVFIGDLLGVDASPVHTHTPLLGAQLDLAADTATTLRVDPAFEHAFLLDEGELTVEGVDIAHAELGIVDPGPDTLTVTAGPQGPASSCSAVPPSRRTSSCGGTSSAPTTTTSSRRARSGRTGPTASARCPATGVSPRGCPRRSCRRCACAPARATSPSRPPARR